MCRKGIDLTVGGLIFQKVRRSDSVLPRWELRAVGLSFYVDEKRVFA